VVGSPGFARGETKVIQSQGRIAGTSEIYLFNFTAAQEGPGITLKESPPFIAKQSNGSSPTRSGLSDDSNRGSSP
jgi:hypothetical protein